MKKMLLSAMILLGLGATAAPGAVYVYHSYGYRVYGYRSYYVGPVYRYYGYRTYYGPTYFHYRYWR